MDNSESDMVYLRGEIIDYLRKNPNAGDSLEGLMSRWLSRNRGKIDVANVEQVLEQLITEGLVKKISLVGGTMIDRTNKQD